MTDQKLIRIAALVGVGLAVPSMIYLLLLPQPLYIEHLAIFLAAIAGVYLGFAAMDGRIRNMILETTVVAVFIALAIVGLKFSLLILAFAYFAHGVWDVFHHPKAIDTKIVAWYPPFCAMYDWSIAAFILVYFYL